MESSRVEPPPDTADRRAPAYWIIAGAIVSIIMAVGVLGINYVVRDSPTLMGPIPQWVSSLVGLVGACLGGVWFVLRRKLRSEERIALGWTFVCLYACASGAFVFRPRNTKAHLLFLSTTPIYLVTLLAA